MRNGESPFFETPNLSFEGRVRNVARAGTRRRGALHTSHACDRNYHVGSRHSTLITLSPAVGPAVWTGGAPPPARARLLPVSNYQLVSNWCAQLRSGT